MVWKLDKKRPVCPQLCEQLCVFIAAGELQAEERLPSVRELAVQAGVNPNTVQRSFETLEQQGILFSVRGSGWYVSADTTLARQTLERLLAEKTAAFFAEMHALGLSAEETKSYVKEYDYE